MGSTVSGIQAVKTSIPARMNLFRREEVHVVSSDATNKCEQLRKLRNHLTEELRILKEDL
jgi:hypothetical protein